MNKRTKMVLGILVLLCIIGIVFGIRHEKEDTKKMEENIFEALQSEPLKKNFSCAMEIDDRYTIHIVKEEDEIVADISEKETGWTWKEDVLSTFYEGNLKKKEACTFEELEKRFEFSMEEIVQDWKSYLAKKDELKVSNKVDEYGLFTWEIEKLTKKQMVEFRVTSSNDGKYYGALAVRNTTRMDYKQKVQYEICYYNSENVDPSTLIEGYFISSCWSMKQIKGEEEIDSFIFR